MWPSGHKDPLWPQELGWEQVCSLQKPEAVMQVGIWTQAWTPIRDQLEEQCLPTWEAPDQGGRK